MTQLVLSLFPGIVVQGGDVIFGGDRHGVRNLKGNVLVMTYLAHPGKNSGIFLSR